MGRLFFSGQMGDTAQKETFTQQWMKGRPGKCVSSMFGAFDCLWHRWKRHEGSLDQTGKCFAQCGLQQNGLATYRGWEMVIALCGLPFSS